VTVLGGLGAALALRRGIRLFAGSDLGWGGAALAVGVVLLAGALPVGDGWRPVQAVLNFGALAAVYLGIAGDLWRHARDGLHWRWPALLALPALLGALALAGRAGLALLRPGSVLTEMTQPSALNVASALVYTVLVLLLHATLLALVAARLLGELQQLARRDPLTGLLNRRAMHELLDAQAAQSRRATDTFAVLLIDLDHFKPINDEHGHEVGDRALAHVAQHLAQALRPDDRLGRIGGDEFVALLPGRDLAFATAEAERLRVGLQRLPLAHGGGVLPLSLSIGVAQWAGAGEDVARLLARADDALLRAKRAGRGRVEPARDGPALSAAARAGTAGASGSSAIRPR
jgi:diguanylate cyclase (GGDEF)-like protein